MMKGSFDAARRKANVLGGASRAAKDVVAERQRQIAGEGFTSEHDDAHQHGELAGAAACYALNGVVHSDAASAVKQFWPWEDSWWKPQDRRADLVRAGALILAEIERIDRKQ